ncbi:hypothetical protein VPHD479_0240 [Vibrio phage D479]
MQLNKLKEHYSLIKSVIEKRGHIAPKPKKNHR